MSAPVFVASDVFFFNSQTVSYKNEAKKNKNARLIFQAWILRVKRKRHLRSNINKMNLK